MCIAIVCFPGCDVKNLEIMTKNSGLKFEYRENEKSYLSEIKACFIIFKGLSVANNYLTTESTLLRLY